MNQTRMAWRNEGTACKMEGIRQAQTDPWRVLMVAYVIQAERMLPMYQLPLYMAVIGARCVGYANSVMRSGAALVAIQSPIPTICKIEIKKGKR